MRACAAQRARALTGPAIKVDRPEPATLLKDRDALFLPKCRAGSELATNPHVYYSAQARAFRACVRIALRTPAGDAGGSSVEVERGPVDVPALLEHVIEEALSGSGDGASSAALPVFSVPKN